MECKPESAKCVHCNDFATCPSVLEHLWESQAKERIGRGGCQWAMELAFEDGPTIACLHREAESSRCGGGPCPEISGRE